MYTTYLGDEILFKNSCRTEKVISSALFLFAFFFSIKILQDPTERYFVDDGILTKYHDNNNKNNKKIGIYFRDHLIVRLG